LTVHVDIDIHVVDIDIDRDVCVNPFLYFVCICVLYLCFVNPFFHLWRKIYTAYSQKSKETYYSVKRDLLQCQKRVYALSLYIYIHTKICMYVCMYVCTHTHTYTYIYISFSTITSGGKGRHQGSSR